MKRDLDRIRELLFEIEDLPTAEFSLSDLSNSEEDDYQFNLMLDEGFVILIEHEGVNFGPPFWADGLAKMISRSYRLTSKGHDFLETIRDEAIWEKAKAGLNKVSGATLGMLASIAVALGKAAIETKLGIKL